MTTAPTTPTTTPKGKIVVATINAPEGTDATKRALANPRARALLIRDKLNDNNIDVGLVQETGSALLGAMSHQSSRYDLGMAIPNNVYASGRIIGNGVITRNADVRVMDENDIDIPWGKQGLHLPCRLMQITATGDRFVVISLHSPTEKADPSDETRALIRKVVQARVDRYRAAGLPVIVGGDFNDGTVAFRGMRVAHKQHVDWIFVYGFSASVKRTLDLGRASDHNGTVATLTVSVSNRTARRLPR
jgi:endonuclease/exonuclease/phosphatase family metal-dependent hydrolase